MSRKTETQKTADYIQPDRRTQIARLRLRNRYALAFWLCSTWGVFLLMWAIYLKPLEPSLVASIITAMLTSFVYLNERRTNDPKEKRLMKYEVLFADFFEAMITDMDRNNEEKGDSWLTIDLAELRRLQNQKWGELQTPGSKKSVSAHYEHQPKLANYSAMTYLRMELEIKNAVKDKYDRPGR